ncbi:MAG: GGDEF domain-containing protein [Propionibacteriales bacterium]|nr:GGDEF domain-containing protein [Propionibacteriales bacterium]
MVHLADSDGIEAVAHCGRDANAPVVGSRRSFDTWQTLLDASTGVGKLRFCRDVRPFLDEAALEPAASELALLGDDDVWGAANLLLAPLHVGNKLVGIVTISMGVGEPVLDELTCTMLEILTLQAAVIVHQHRIYERASADHLALRLSEERFRLAFDNAPIGVAEVVMAESGPVIARINRAAGAMFGASAIGARHEPVDQVFTVVRGEPLSRLIGELFDRRRTTLRVEMPFVGTDGGEFWGLVEAAALDHSPGEPGVLCQIVDITQAKAEKRELTKLAQHDALTGLPNRLVIMERLNAAVRTATETNEVGALLFCDLDHFKAINDEQGHLVGDDALAALATRLHSVVRTSDTAGRFGGDEFVVVSFPLPEEAAERLAERISMAMNAPMGIDGYELQVGVSIGIAMITPGVNAGEVLRRADAAMYAVRSRRDRPLYVLDAG